jgi:hypothetical protein
MGRGVNTGALSPVGGIPGGTRRSVGSLLRGSRSGIERRSSGRRR